MQSAYPYYPTDNEFFDLGGIPIDVHTSSTGSWSNGCLYSAPSFKAEDGTSSPVNELLGMLESTDEPQTVRERGVWWAGQYGLYGRLAMDEEMRFADEALTGFYEEKHSGSMGTFHRALSDFQHQRHAGANAADHLAALQGMESAERPEQRLAEVLHILYSNIHDLKAIDAGDQAHLREIAKLCPLDDGFGVYIARAALLKVDTFPRFYTSECERIPAPEDARWKNEDGNSKETAGIAVYPNPNNGQMTVAYRLGEGERGVLSIYSTLGGLVFQRPLAGEADRMDIDVMHLRSGIYLLHLDVNGERSFTERLSILRE